jgi:hypothetical protein
MSMKASQLPNVERFTEYRNDVVQRIEGRKLNAKAAAVFGMTDDTRIASDSEIVLPVAGVMRRLILWFSTTGEDVFLVEARRTASGSYVVVKIFHTDVRTLSLRSAATGESINDLQLIANDLVENEFREMLMVWDRAVMRILERHKKR